MIADNLKKLKLKESVTLIAVSKTIDFEKMKEAIEAGVEIFGENKVQEAHEKFRELQKYRQELEVMAKAYGDAEFLENYRKVKWHLIGHLQTNKVKFALEFADLIHSVDSLSLLQSINKQARHLKKVQNILVQVNTSGEESKFGMSIDAAREFFKTVTDHENEYCSNVKICGLMTIAPLTDDQTAVRDCFRKAKDLFDDLKQEYFGYSFIEMKYLSMGMSGDYELAIEEGSNMVRIGSAIFGARNYGN